MVRLVLLAGFFCLVGISGNAIGAFFCWFNVRGTYPSKVPNSLLF